jgi:hypothetical protein
LAMVCASVKTVIGRDEIGKRGWVCRLGERFRGQVRHSRTLPAGQGWRCPEPPSDRPAPGLPNFLVSPGYERCPEPLGGSGPEQSHEVILCCHHPSCRPSSRGWPSQCC